VIKSDLEEERLEEEKHLLSEDKTIGKALDINEHISFQFPWRREFFGKICQELI